MSSKNDIFSSSLARAAPPPRPLGRAITLPRTRAPSIPKPPTSEDHSHPSLSYTLPKRLSLEKSPELSYNADHASLIGSGRSADVYGGRYLTDSGNWEDCAVKRVHDDPECRALGERETWFLRTLEDESDHPGQAHVIRLLGVIDTESRVVAVRTSMPTHVRTVSDPTPSRPSPLLILLPLAPLSLHSVIHSSPHLLTPATHSRIARELSLALSFIHSHGIVHTDIKPQNILLTPSLSVQLADFNTALHLPSLSQPIDTLGLGTAVYAPREFHHRHLNLGINLLPAADIFSLGVTLTVALTAREPYTRLISRSRAELTMWLRRGYFWEYEAQERAGDFLQEEVEVSTRRTFVEFGGLATPPPSPSRAQHRKPKAIGAPYADGSPAMFYLAPHDGGESLRVPDALVSLLASMCAPLAEDRPSVTHVIRTLSL